MAYELNVPGLVKDRQVKKGLPSELKESEQFFFASQEEQRAFLPIWYRNIAFYMGFQWLDLLPGNTNFLTLPHMPTWKVKLVVNLVMPTLRTEAAKILRINPYIATVPSSDTEEARQSSRMATRIMDGKYHDDNFQRKLYNLVMWMLNCGSSYLWTLWDPTAGRAWSDQIKNPATGELITHQFFSGDVIDEVTGPFEVFKEPQGPEEFEDHRRIQRVRLLEVDFIKDKWGVTVPPETIDHQSQFRNRLASLAHLHQFGLLTSSSNHFNNRRMVLVKEEFHLPSGKHPNGLHAMWGNDHVIVDPEPLDYWLRGRRALPVSQYDHITVPGRSNGMSNTEQIGPLNVQYNKLNSMALENANLLSRPKIKAPQGSLDDDSWTDQPGEVVEYRPIGGLGPEPVTPPQMPAYFFQLMDSMPGKISDVSGIQDVSRGKLPRRATSGKAIDLLQDADDTRMGLTVRNFGSSLERSMTIKLEVMKRKYREERLIKKVGRAHGVEVLRFKASDLKDADTVRVLMQPALSRGAKIQIGLKLGESKIISPDKALKIMELGDLNIAFDEDSDQQEFARMENFAMSRGEVIEPSSYEPHDVHIQEHEGFLRRWASKLPTDIRQLFQQHIEITKELAQLTASPGSPPSVGAPAIAGPGGPAQPTPPGL